MAAGNKRHGLFVRARGSARPVVEHDCDGWMGRSEVEGGAIPANRKFERADAVRFARGGAACEFDWDGAD